MSPGGAAGFAAAGLAKLMRLLRLGRGAGGSVLLGGVDDDVGALLPQAPMTR